MALVPQEQWDAFYHAYMDNLPSLSPLRALGETSAGPLHRLLRNIDGSEHVQVVELLASLGHPDSHALLNSIANADPVQHPDRQKDRRLAQEILEKVGKPTSVSVAPVSAASANSRELADANAELAWLREENARLRAQVAQQAVAVSTELAIPVESSTTGDRVGRLVDSVQDGVDLALSMDATQRQALKSSFKVLEITQNGS